MGLFFPFKVWVNVCTYASLVYLLVIFGGQYWMADRPRFEMRRVLFIWNSTLALFSILGACRTVPEFLHVLTTEGTYHSMCISRYVLTSTENKMHPRYKCFFSYLTVTSKTIGSAASGPLFSFCLKSQNWATPSLLFLENSR